MNVHVTSEHASEALRPGDCVRIIADKRTLFEGHLAEPTATGRHGDPTPH